MKNKLLILCPGRQTYLVSLFEKYFDVYIGDNDGIAKKVDAYLYDETKSAWVNVNTGEVLTA